MSWPSKADMNLQLTRTYCWEPFGGVMEALRPVAHVPAPGLLPPAWRAWATCCASASVSSSVKRGPPSPRRNVSARERAKACVLCLQEQRLSAILLRTTSVMVQSAVRSPW